MAVLKNKFLSFGRNRLWFSLVLGVALLGFRSTVWAQPPSFAYVANSGSNDVSAYIIDPTSGALTPVPESPFPAGAGPYAVTVDPTGRFAYVANSASHNVSAYTIDATSGALTPVPESPFPAGFGPISVATTAGPIL